MSSKDPNFALWLARLAPNTQAAYSLAWRQLEAFRGALDGLEYQDIAAWVADLRTKKRSSSTIALKLAAVSSYFAFLERDLRLQVQNPACGRMLRPKVALYGKATHLDQQSVKKLLWELNRAKPVGARDYALILAYIVTMRRNTELRMLKYGDISFSSGAVWYTWSGKGKTDQRFELPAEVWEAIEYYLKVSGRLATIQPGDYIFSSISSAGRRPLTMRWVNRMLKRHLRRAGLDEKIHIHSLRHTGALLRKAAGINPADISADLGHSNLAVTSIYLQAIEGRRDQSSRKVMELIQ